MSTSPISGYGRPSKTKGEPDGDRPEKPAVGYGRRGHDEVGRTRLKSGQPSRLI